MGVIEERDVVFIFSRRYGKNGIVVEVDGIVCGFIMVFVG
jgi:hypothetical protein